MVHIHANREFPCTRCGPRPEGEGDGNCPECMGLGYKAVVTRQKVVLTKPWRGLDPDVDTILGLYPDSRFRAYFPAISPISSGDFLCEVQWSIPNVTAFTGEPVRIIHAYTVEQSEIQYFDGQAIYTSSFLNSADPHINAITSAFAARRR